MARVSRAWVLPLPQGLLGFPGGAVIKNPLANAEEQEAQIRALGWEDPLEKEMETCSIIPAWKIPWTEEPGGLQPMGSQKSWTLLNS